MTMELAIQPGEMRLVRKPREALAEATEAAGLLMDYVNKNKLSRKFGGEKEHLYIEAWQFLAHMYGIVASSPSCEPFQDEITTARGFVAIGEARMISTGIVIAQATAMCMDDEDNWDERPKYEYDNGKRTKVDMVKVPDFQLRGMAQTRAMSRVLRGVLAFVVVLAEYSPTPAEEMTNGNRSTNVAVSAGATRGDSVEGNRINDAQRKRLFAKMYSSGIGRDQFFKMLKDYGFATAYEVTTEKYDQVCAHLDSWGKNGRA
ncbi:MAG: hypothetical protein WAN65_16080 [Candidatus Sulfotelmatobacter sp.]